MSVSINSQVIQQKIFMIRGQKVMIDRDLAELYGVSTKQLNQQVKRNKSRFPNDFMFRLTKKEFDELVTICDHLKFLKFSYQMPFVFTEQGVAMLSSVLNSDRAIKINIQIMRVFVRLKELMISHKDLALKIEQLEHKFKDHDQKITLIFEAIKQLLQKSEEPEKPKRGIGFHVR